MGERRTGSQLGVLSKSMAIWLHIEKRPCSIMTRSHRYLNELLLEAKKAYMAAQEHNISIYVSDS